MASDSLRLLLVDDDPEFLGTAAAWFTARGHAVTHASGGEEALSLAGRFDFDVVVSDLRMPGLSGVDLLGKLREACCEAEALLLTGEGTIETAVEAMKLGAYDYVLKPCRLEELERRCRKAAEAGLLRRENRNLRSLVARTTQSAEILGNSAAMREVFRVIAKAGPSSLPVLIEGESGTGKELVARALHRASPRADKPLVTVNCAALPTDLLESEFFGHEKGAFTGAVTGKTGLFEAADGGTLFVDEIGELAPPLQAKLLRALEDGSFRRVGSLKERKSDARVVAATNRDLTKEVAAGRFREDLYYRLNVLSLRLPPLRERDGDVSLLASEFLRGGWELDPLAREAVERHAWPGNVRQLKNALERAKVLAEGVRIRLCDLPADVAAEENGDIVHTEDANGAFGHAVGGGEKGFVASATPAAGGDDLESLERTHVLAVMRRERGNKSRAARALGVNRRTLYRMLERFGAAGAASDGAGGAA